MMRSNSIFTTFGGATTPASTAPLSFPQQRLWFLDRLAPGSTAYTMPEAVRMEGRLQQPALAAAFGEIVRRHAPLRTTFSVIDGEPAQVIHPPTDPAAFFLPCVDLSALGALGEDRAEAEAMRAMAAVVELPFDLHRGPLFRPLLVRLRHDHHFALAAMHHIVVDGWSLGLLLRELGALYGAFRLGLPSPLAALPTQYADFAVWQRQHVAATLETEIAWWRQRLDGVPRRLELPADRPRPAVPTHRGGTVPASLPATVGKPLAGLARSAGATLFMALLAAWQALLGRLSGQDSFTVGVPVAGRRRVELEGLIGFFVSSLALPADLAGDPSFHTLLGRVKETALGAFLHQDLPLERLVEELAPERSGSLTPLFQVMFALQNAPRGPVEIRGLKLRPIAPPSHSAKVDLTLALAEEAGGLTGHLEYSSDLFEAATAARIAGWLTTLAAGAGERPETPLSALPLLTAAEIDQLASWNGTAVPYPRERSIAELFAAVAAARPGAPAVVHGEITLTYAELDRRARSLAAHLQRLGVFQDGLETRVAILLPRSPAMVVATLAVVQAGGAYVPLDPDQPAERLSWIVQDSRAAFVLTPDNLDDVPPGDPAPGGADGGSLAYVMYTSGSTGQPKGVAVPHRAVVRLVRDTDYVRLTAADRVAQAANVAFDAATFEIWGALLNGGCLVILDKQDLLGTHVGDRLRDAGITTLFLTTALFNQIARAEPAAFTTVGNLLFGGEAVDPRRVRAVLAAGGPERLLHVYGPTETTTFTSWHEVGAVPAGAATVPIGRPLANAWLHVLDAHLRPVPPGVPGELYVGGDGVARCYLDRPDLTAERFIPDPFAGAEGGRLYRTGDRARRRPEGAIELLGRLDRQIKLRGFRIEPGEIEAVLREHPDVRDAAVEARADDPNGDKRLVAYVSGIAGADGLQAADLRGFLEQRLPAWMVPAAFTVLDALPLNANGKVDRGALAALPAPDVKRTDAPTRAPRDAVEEKLAAIWSDLLRVERIGIDDDFFALGGHSLLATRMVTRVQEAFGVELTVAAVFATPTVAGIAAQVRDTAAAQHGVLPAAAEGTDSAPLSFAQQRLWFLDRLAPESTAYNMPVAVRLDGRLDVRALALSFGEIVRRHAALRTTFTEVDGEPLQVISPAGDPAGFAIPYADLSVLGERDPGAAEAEAVRVIAEAAQQPFDLVRGPLFRPLLVRLRRDHHLALAAMHHIVGDGWSLSVLVGELGALYAAFRAGLPSPLPPLRWQYTDFARWQRQQLASVESTELAWWRQLLHGVPHQLELPADRPRPAVPTYRGGSIEVVLPAATAGSVADLARGHGATLFMVLLAAWQALLGRLSGQEGFTVGVPIAGRRRIEIEGLIGFFVNSLALPADLAGDPSFRTLLGRVKDIALGAFAHQDLPLERLVEELAPERSRAQAPLFQVMFALQNSPYEPLVLPELTLLPLEPPVHTAKVDLTLSLAAVGEAIAGHLEYSRDLFEAATAARIAGWMRTLAAGAAARPETPLSELPLLTAGEADQLAAWNATTAPPPRERSIADLFAEVAAARPGAPAVVHGEHTLTYAALDRQARSLAAHLQRLGVVQAGLESRVAILIPRSPAMVIATLAVVQAGGAYVPLDPDQPAERLSRIVQDSQAAFVLTADNIDVPPGDPVPGGAEGGSLAYVMYTSGSTGQPKGVGVSHRAVIRLVRDTGYVHLTAADRVAQAANVAFDAATFEIWGALLNGGCLVILDKGDLLGSRVGDRLRDAGITTLFLTTALFNRIARDEPGAFNPLRNLLFGGEAVDPRQVRAVLAAGGPERLLHVYGPTETTTFASWHRVEAVAAEATTVPIGLPLANDRLHVFDPHLLPVPPGMPGELYIGGDGVARGYLERPELTAERFVPDPLAAAAGTPGGRLYRTGDRVRQRPDGPLELLGRIDRQVKLRGFRIEPGEIEAALAEHPDVRQAAILVRADGPDGDKRLVAYVSGAAGLPSSRLQAADLRRFLEQRLPAWMVPSAFAVLDSLPLNANGKVDRDALAATTAPTTWRSGAAGGYVPPRDAVEEKLAALWADLLQVERVGIHDDFFALGGHSLLVTRLSSRAQEVFGVEVPVAAVFDTPTVAGLAERLRGTPAERAPAAPAPVLAPAPEAEWAPLSFGQQRLWFLHRLDAKSVAYNIPVAVRLIGRLNVPALAAAFGSIVRRHAVLRTTYDEIGGEPVQTIAPPLDPAAFPLSCADLSGLGERTGDAARRLAAEEAERPFDLARGPLLRLLLVRVERGEHVILATMHHSVSDGWSMSIFVNELKTFYAAYRMGLPAAVPELPLRYADFARWQRAYLAGERLEAEIAWWRDRLAGLPPHLELPFDRPRRTTGGGDLGGWTVFDSAPPSVAAAARSLALRHAGTPFVVVLAVYQAFLGRLAGTDDLAVGVPVSGRTRREVEGLIGFFVNSLVLRADLAGDPPFQELLGRAREVSVSAQAHQELPFERLVEALQPERSLGISPLFQVMLAFQNTPREPLEIRGLTFQPVPVEWKAAQFDLTLTVEETPDGFAIAWEARRALFDQATVERFAARFKAFLAGSLQAPETRLSDLPLLLAAERDQVLAAGVGAVGAVGDEEPAYPALLHAAFFAQAERAPQAVAWDDGVTTLSYGELAGRAWELARSLRRQGVGPEIPVGVGLERTADGLAALLAVLAAGGVYLPLDPAYPADRRGALLRAAGARVLLTRAALRHDIETDVRVAVLCVDDGEAAVDPDSVRPLPPLAAPESLAYLIYTSGSTGEPKGVGVPHAAAAAHVAGMSATLGLGTGDRVLWFASPSFDVSLEQVLPALAAGATVVPRGEELWSPAGLTRRLAGLEVTVADLPAAYWEQWVGDGATAGPAGAAPRLRLVSAGGEALSSAAAQRWSTLWPAGAAPRLVNGYGPTEAVITATVFTVSPDDGPGAGVPIGSPLPGRTARVIDPHGNLQPLGVPGELCLGGLLARGYLDRPEPTAERFVPDPWAAVPGARLYRSGDLARLRPDGALEFLGRIDRQVKIRGFRVEPGEVEACLAAHPAIRETAVDIRPAANGEHRLIAWFVPCAGAAFTDLPDYLAARLPAAFVPAAFMALPSLPLTPSGKIDRRALPDPDAGAAGGDQRGAPAVAGGTVEETLAAIWREVLGVERVGLHDNFFSLGGHSLLATRVVARVQALLGVEIPLAAVFEAPTPAGLARRVESELQRTSQEAPPLLPAASSEPAPLSFSQERLWLLDQLIPGTAVYNMPVSMRLTGPLDVRALAGAIAGVARRHGSLRTTFRIVSGTPVQVVGATRAWLPFVDLSGLPDSEREREAQRLAAEDAGRPFDLAAGPLFRPFLLRLAGGEHALFTTMHHIVSDGWSMEIFLRDVATLYAGAPLPPLPVQYTDFARWQRSWLRGDALATRLAWWTASLSGAPQVLDLPMEHPRPAVQTFRGAAVVHRLGPEVTGALHGLCRDTETTLFMALLAGFGAVLARYSGATDLVFGSPISGRGRTETEGLIGFFLNTLALRIDLAGEPSLRALLGRIRATTIGAYSHSDLPFESLLEELRPERDLARTPLFQVMVNWLGFDAPGRREPLSLPALTVESFAAGQPLAKFDLELYGEETDGGIALRLVYNRDLFGAGAMAALMGHLEAVLAGGGAAPDRPLASLPLTPGLLLAPPPHPAESLADVAATDFPPGALGSSLSERFDRIAAAHAGRPAVITPDGAWTYGELRAAADRAAHALLSRRGPGAERIALLFSPGMPLVAAVLGTLKAGKTYVPLDPAYPPERLRFIVEDAQAAAVLAEDGLVAMAAELAADRLPILHGVWEDGDLPPVPAGWSPPAVPAEALAYLLYTSGSTGQPKGVMQSHRNVLHHIRAYSRRLRLHPDDRLTLLPSFSFDAAVMDLFGALLNGAALCVWDLKAHGFTGLARWLAAERVTVYHSTPTLYRSFLGFLDGTANGGAAALPHLRLVVLGGEEVTAHDLQRFRALFPPGCRLINGLGPTESTLALQWTCDGALPDTLKEVPVGHPVDDTEVALLTAAGEQAAVWGSGEIAIRSAFIAPGYWRRADLTAEAFVPAADGGRAYRTGDLGRLLPDGGIAFLGRRDLQVKIRGVRVEPGEVEAVLATHPALREAAVAVRSTANGEPRLVAWVVPRDGAVPADLRDYLARRLPDAFVPAAFAALPALPLTPSGKVDRRALPDPEWDAAGPAGDQRMPRTPTEEIVAAVWAQLLGRDRVGIDDDFFRLGGQSLSGVQAVSRLREVFAIDLPLRALFEAPTVAGLAAEIERRRGAGINGGAAIVPLAEFRGERGTPAPLSLSQERFWRRREQERRSIASTIVTVVRLSGPLDVGALRRAIDALVERHEVLRTTFVEQDGRAVQIVHPPAPISLPVIDLISLPEADQEAEVRRVALRDDREPFDFATGPFLRQCLFSCAPEERILSSVVHHSVIDGWSGPIVTAEIGALYQAFHDGAPSPLAPLPMQVQDHARWQRQPARLAEIERQRAYWRETLRGAVPIDFTAGRPGRRGRSGRSASAPVKVPLALGQAAQAFSTREGVTLFMTLLAAFQAVLFHTTGQTDVTVTSHFANRTQPGIEGLIGNFFASLPLRVQVDGGGSFRDLLARVRRTILEAHDNADAIYEEILAEQGAGDEDLGATFRVRFALNNLPAGPALAGISALRSTSLTLDTGRMRLDLTFLLYQDGDQLYGRLRHDVNVLTPDAALAIRDGFLRFLERAVAAPDSTLDDLLSSADVRGGDVALAADSPNEAPVAWADA